MNNLKDQSKYFSPGSVKKQLDIAKALIVKIAASELKFKRLCEINKEIFPKK